MLYFTPLDIFVLHDTELDAFERLVKTNVRSIPEFEDMLNRGYLGILIAEAENKN